MRKFRLLTLLLLASTFIFVNCTKEGPEGPAGATGAQGPAGNTGATGAAGAAGTANVIYSAWTPYVTGTWSAAALEFGSNVRTYPAPAPGVTTAIINQGVILVYHRFTGGSGNMYSLPAVINDVAPKSFTVLPALGIINLKLFFLTGVADPGIYSSPTEYRYVLIPGGVLGGRGGNTEKVAEIEGQVYTETQLKAMSYSEICGLLKIAQ